MGAVRQLNSVALKTSSSDTSKMLGALYSTRVSALQVALLRKATAICDLSLFYMSLNPFFAFLVKSSA